MSGIYIPGMEMPVTCCHCPLMGYDPDREWYDSMAQTGAHICVLTGELIDNTKREEHCPIVPVPDHGDLIDADALLHDMNRMVLPDDLAYTIGHGIAEQFIENAPTIIPADKEGADEPADTTVEGMIERWEQEKAINVYDQREVHENVTVEIWSNSETGETSIGWWPNEGD